MTYITIIFASATGLIGLLLGWLLASAHAQTKIKNAYQQSSQQTNDAEIRIKQIFENLSAQALQNNANQYLQQSNTHLQTILSPLYKDLQNLHQKIHEVDKNREGTYQSISGTVLRLNQEIQNLQNSNLKLNLTTQSLNQALRADHSTRGRWGEIQLRRIVEISGMKEHIDFDEQKQISQGTQSIRPDMIIRMPQEGIIPVDAKTPMSAYLDACNASTKEEAKSHLDRHKKALELHIRELSKKEYWNQSHFSSSPQLVVMFVPYESGLETSLSNDPDLLDKALSNKVIIAGPSSLYALLKVISYGWMQVALTKNTEEIYNMSKELFQRFKTFYEHFSKIGDSLNTAASKFNDAAGSLHQRFIPTLRQINTMSASPQNLPDEVSSVNTIAKSQNSLSLTSSKDYQ